MVVTRHRRRYYAPLTKRPSRPCCEAAARVGCCFNHIAFDDGGSDRSRPMIHSVSIRPAIPSDIASLIPLFEELDEHHRVALPGVFRKPADAGREQSWPDSLIAGPDRTIRVAEAREKNVIGLVVLVTRSIPASIVRDARRFVEIEELVVASRVRRRGVGRSLLDAAKLWARERGIAMLEVSAWSFNLDTIEFYHKIGFRRTTERFAMPSN
jgi:GNAT superfamily N-acetyltransferase